MIRFQAGEILWRVERRWDVAILLGFHYYKTKKLISISYLKVSVENYDNGLNILIFVSIQAKKGELRPPKLKTEDPNKSYVQRPVKRGWFAWFWPGRSLLGCCYWRLPNLFGDQKVEGCRMTSRVFNLFVDRIIIVSMRYLISMIFNSTILVTNYGPWLYIKVIEWDWCY